MTHSLGLPDLDGLLAPLGSLPVLGALPELPGLCTDAVMSLLNFDLGALPDVTKLDPSLLTVPALGGLGLPSLPALPVPLELPALP